MRCLAISSLSFKPPAITLASQKGSTGLRETPEMGYFPEKHEFQIPGKKKEVPKALNF